MEGDGKDSNNKTDTDQINIDLNKVKLEEDKKEADQFDTIAEENKQLNDTEQDNVVSTVVKDKENVPENIIDVNEQLFNKDASWETLGVPEAIQKGLIEKGFTRPSRIQATAYPLIMKKPHSHLIAQAHNGAGKTGAFGIGLLSRIDETKSNIQAVVFAHTRELVNQIAGVLAQIAKYTNIKVTPLLNTNKDAEVGHIIVCTPGNFDKTFFGRKLYSMKDIKVLVLDEADYMLDNDMTSNICEKTFNYILTNKLETQVLFFSATFSDENFRAIKKYFKKAAMIEVKKGGLTLQHVRQMYYKCNKREEKVDFVEEYLKRNIEQERVIIFVNTKDFTDKLTQLLRKKGYKVFLLMGGNMDPKERDETIKRFNKGEIQILITTNVLARGFDEKLVKLIINFDLPVTRDDGKTVPDIETYLHRIGRTGRFGTKGIGLTLISSDIELGMLKEIEKFYLSNIEEITSMDDLITEFKKILADKF